jgi:hypothetical protein
LRGLPTTTVVAFDRSGVGLVVVGGCPGARDGEERAASSDGRAELTQPAGLGAAAAAGCAHRVLCAL